MSQEELKAENEQLKKEKERLQTLLAEYQEGARMTSPYADVSSKNRYGYNYYYDEEQRAAVRKVFDFFRSNKKKKGEMNVEDMVEMAKELGTDLDPSEAQAMIEEVSLSSSKTGLSFEEFYGWWNNEPSSLKTKLDILKTKIRSQAFLRSVAHYLAAWKKIEKPDLSDKIMKFHGKAKAGDFDEALSAINLRFSNDPAVAKAFRDECKIGPSAIILSASFTLKPDIDEFELGELAGTIGDILLMGKKKLQFHSHKSQLVKERGERVMRFSIFYDEHKDVDAHIKPLFHGLQLQRAEGRVECSQRPGGPETDQFIMARGEGWVELGASMVEFMNEKINDHKSETYRNVWNMLAIASGIDFDVDVGSLEKGYNKFAVAVENETPLFKGVRGFNSLKPLIMPLALDLHNDNSIPAPVKDAYYSATTFLRGVHTLRIQIDDSSLSLEGEGVDIFDLLPTKADITSYRPPPAPQAPVVKPVKPLFSTDECKIVMIGSGGVGKSALTVQFVQGIFVEHYDPTIEDTYRKYVDIDDQNYTMEVYDTVDSSLMWGEHYFSQASAFVFVFSITDRASFDALNGFKDQVLRWKNQVQPPIVLVANKMDLANESALRKVSTNEAQDLADKWGVPYMEASAKTRVNVQELFETTVRAVFQKPASEEDGGVEEWFLAAHTKSV